MLLRLASVCLGVVCAAIEVGPCSVSLSRSCCIKNCSANCGSVNRRWCRLRPEPLLIALWLPPRDDGADRHDDSSSEGCVGSVFQLWMDEADDADADRSIDAVVAVDVLVMLLFSSCCL